MDKNSYKVCESQMENKIDFEQKSDTLSSWNLIKYISSLSDENVEIIFTSISCVVELFSSLPEIQQLIISRLLILGENNNRNISEKAINLWVLPSKQSELIAALKDLRSLRIIKADLMSEVDQKKSVGTLTIQYSLNRTFQKTLLSYICNGALEMKFKDIERIDELNISYVSLSKFSKRKWSGILDIIVELSGYNSYKKVEIDNIFKRYGTISSDIIGVLRNIKLVSWNSQKELRNSDLNDKNGMRINLDLPLEDIHEIYDGLDERDDNLLYQEQKKEFDVYNDIEYLDFDLNNNSDNQENPTVNNSKRLLIKKQDANASKNEMDEIFEQKLVPRAFCWLLCDICNQILILVNGFIQLLEQESIHSTEKCYKKKGSSNLINPKIADVISFMFRISSSKIGQPIQINSNSNDNHFLTRFILFSYDLGLIYIDEEMITLYKDNYRKNPKEFPHISKIYTTPYSMLLSSNGFKLQGLYSVFKLTTNDPTDYASSNIKDILLPSHFYYNEKHWFDLTNKKIELKNEKCNEGKSCAQIEAGIIVQSNFRIYCYTASPLQAKILRHLCQVKVRGPNIITGILTRKGLLSAYSMGVSAEQIIRFFTSNAHPILIKRLIKDGTALIPIGVETQLKLWEKDNNRLQIIPACIFSEWGSSQYDIELYKQTVLYAKGRNVVIYSTDLVGSESCIKSPKSNGELIMIIRQEYESDIKEFIRAKKEIIRFESSK